jgi:serine phosphatase RsbU (regulator of sigma subunit)/anti-sigma regulatory factor (Ser/Thr protein kinase)
MTVAETAGPLPPAASTRPAAPAPRRRALSLRLIVTATAVGLTIGAMLSVGWVAERNAREVLTRELEARLMLQARSLAAGSADALLQDFPELALQPLARQLTRRHRELAFVAVIDHAGVVKGHSDARLLQGGYTPPPELHAANAAGLDAGETLQENADLLVAGSPVRQADGRVLGRAVVGLHRAYLDRALLASRREQAVVLAAFVLLGALLAWALVSLLLRPIAPIRAGIQRIGRGDLETPIALRDATEFGLLAGTIDDMARSLRAAQLEMVERERLAHEVELARRLQLSLVPQGITAAGDLEIVGSMEPANEVGGDYYDVLHLPDGRIGVAIADVSGKGLEGCLVMTMVSVLLRALRGTHTSPAAMLAALDERLCESLRPGVFVTMLYAVVDPERGTLVWASAGHNPLLVRRHATGEVERLVSPGIPLAALHSGAIRRTLRDHTVELAPGDRLLMYTDGFTEADAPGTEEQFGLERLAERFAAACGCGEPVLADLREALRAWTDAGPLDDDRTALVVCRAAVTADPESASARESRALAALGQAYERGDTLELPAHLGALVALPEWLSRIPVVGAIDGPEAELLRTALHEVCANVIEHGCGGDERQSFEVWWLPAATASPETTGGARPVTTPGEHLRAGTFLIRDHGTPFDAANWHASDFRDTAVRRRGRGIGLDIIHRVMRRVEYVPGTARGNLTLLSFGPRPVADLERSAR